MATIVKTPSGTWKALVRKTGWPATAKTFRTKREAEDWARRTEDEMVRGVYIQRAPSERMTIEDALKRYLSEISPTKRPASADSDARHAKPLMQNLGKYSLAALTPELIAKYRDDRLAGLDRKDAKGKPAPSPVRPTRYVSISHCSATCSTWRSRNGDRPDLQPRAKHSPSSAKPWAGSTAHARRRNPPDGGGRCSLEPNARLDRAHRARNRNAFFGDHRLAPEPGRS